MTQPVDVVCSNVIFTRSQEDIMQKVFKQLNHTKLFTRLQRDGRLEQRPHFIRSCFQTALLDHLFVAVGSIDPAAPMFRKKFRVP